MNEPLVFVPTGTNRSSGGPTGPTGARTTAGGLRQGASPSRADEQTIWEVFEAERPKLVSYAGKFDGFHSV
jgi:hypothetical protein